MFRRRTVAFIVSLIVLILSFEYMQGYNSRVAHAIRQLKGRAFGLRYTQSPRIFGSTIQKHNMTTVANHETAIKDVLDFWFVTASKKWFGPEASKLDGTVTEKFGALVETALSTDELDKTWLNTANGSLAMILLLDQFTRNIYRPGNHPTPGLSWSGDAKALKIASESISKGYDREIQRTFASAIGFGFHHREFFYLPFMHAEELCSQVASVALFENMANEMNLKKMQKEATGAELTEEEKDVIEMIDLGVELAIRHRNCVAKLGKFPARNEPLGRASTDADVQWLKDHPQGF